MQMRYDGFMQTFWRILTNTIFFSIILLVIGGVAGLITREVLLWQGVRTLKDDLRLMLLADVDSICGEKFGEIAQGEVAVRQLRFTSSQDYVTELVCPSFDTLPILLSEHSLDSLISKVPGSAGIVETPSPSESYITITVLTSFTDAMPSAIKPWFAWLNRRETVGLKDGKTFTFVTPEDMAQIETTAIGTGPVSNCEGYGFTCCDAQMQYGMGDMIADVPSCPNTCYTRCLARPLVVSWRSSPMADWESNVVELPAGSPIEFYYVGEDAGSATSWLATIDFGDGEETTAEGKENSVQHTYSCPQGNCEFIARVEIENDIGARSVTTNTSQIKIRVQ